MFDVRLMRRDGIRIAEPDMAQQSVYSGEFVLDRAGGARRLRLRNPWASGYEPIELYEPNLVSARHEVQVWRGFERVGKRGVVQEWLVRGRR